MFKTGTVKLNRLFMIIQAVIFTAFLCCPQIRALAEESMPDTNITAENPADEDLLFTGLADYSERYGLEPAESGGDGQILLQEAKSVSKVSYLAVFVEFPDQSAQIDDAATCAWADRLLNSKNPVKLHYSGGLDYTAPSLHSYVSKYTYGKVDLTATILPRDPADSTRVLAHTMSHNRGYYMPKTDANPDGYESEDEQLKRELAFAKEVMSSVKAQVEDGLLSGMFTAGSIDADGNGFIDAISFFIAGTDSDQNWNELLWPHKLSHSKDLLSGLMILGKKVNAWNLMSGQTGTNESSLFSGTDSTYGVIVHEYMHILGLPDLYRATGKGDPVGGYDVMCQTLKPCPQTLLASMTAEYRCLTSMGWHERLPQIWKSGTYTVKRPSYTDPEEMSAFRIVTPFDTGEYFIVEYYARNELQKFVGGISGFPDTDGLLISRLNMFYTSNLNGGPSNDMLYVFRPGEKSAGAGYGDLSKAVLSLAAGRKSFGVTDLSHTGTDTICFSGGENSGIRVQVLEETEDAITFSVEYPEPVIAYRMHRKDGGWSAFARDGATGGSTGKTADQIRIRLENSLYAGAVKYRTLVHGKGWGAWKSNGATSGPGGDGNYLEAIKIKLTGDLAEDYDIWYRVYSAGKKWLHWAKNGAPAGTCGMNKDIRAVQIRLVKKGGKAPGKTKTAYVTRYVKYRTYLQNTGWKSYVFDGSANGSAGGGKGITALRIGKVESLTSGNLWYRVKYKTGWEKNFVKNGALAGKTKSKVPVEAVQVKLSGNLKKKYDIWYRVCTPGYGWQGWAKNGQSAGTSGYGKGIEAIQVKLLPKGQDAPGKTAGYYIIRNKSESGVLQEQKQRSIFMLCVMGMGQKRDPPSCPYVLLVEKNHHWCYHVVS